ncbi:HAD family hydrolase [Paenibacillus woosongensis]|uniref:HAD-IA family hydrolase n=1 Tax=Paenibacillus woosongensis TaxID=307580 RepID=A0A7X2Z0S9_9BACL|nr:HAD family hydrolase [Paenibacillus woosongensis]MUG45397.1 HAD-IA family hydrolase [Paenibacillus woosongensis]
MAIVQAGDRSVPCQAILFDKDGTLLDFMALWGEWAMTLLDLLDSHLELLGARRIDSRAALLGLKLDERQQIEDYDKTGPLAMGSEEEVTALLAWQLYAAGVPWNEALIQVRQFSSSAMIELRKRRNARPMPGLAALLEASQSQGIRLAVVTSDTTEAASEHLSWMGIERYFDVVVGRDRVSLGKPFPEMAVLACRELGVSPEHAIVVGDSNGDMQMGKQAGVRMTVGLAPDGGGESYLLDADAVIRSFREMKVLEEA